MRLNKSNQTFDRDGKGELLPAKVEVLNPPGKEKLEVWMIPLTLGELNELNASSSYLKDSSTVESEILRAKLIIDGSKLTKNEIRLVPLSWSVCLIKTILYHSGVSLKQLGLESLPEVIRKQQTEFQKNVTAKIKKKSRHSQLICFLHEYGIQYFDMPRLCHFEIDQLIEGHKERRT